MKTESKTADIKYLGRRTRNITMHPSRVWYSFSDYLRDLLSSVIYVKISPLHDECYICIEDAMHGKPSKKYSILKQTKNTN